ncbi:MAG TPA: HEAT repeat domain-containing protein [Acidimicrobiales bacterium]|nr:HEAT repeat domain-containing protein [Acidimicrobiales bacterium]
MEAGHSGDEGAARAVLAHGDPEVRAAALQALHRMGRVTDADVARALRDDDPGVRRRALAVAVPGEIDLLPLLEDRDPSVVEQAAWALGEREDRRAVDGLVRAAAHPDPLVREAAVAALGAIQDERGLGAILAGTDDRPAIRRRAVLALAGFEGPAVDAALARAADDRDWQVRDAAQVILDARGAAPEGGP